MNHGAIFGKLTVIKPTDRRNNEYWCGCVCGHKLMVTLGQLIGGRKKSCKNCRVTGRRVAKGDLNG